MRIRRIALLFVISLLSLQASAGLLQRLFGRGGEQSQQAGDYQKMVVDNLTRQYILHMPSSGTTKALMPLVIMLHGTYGTGASMEENFGFDPYADRHGFMVAYPDAFREKNKRKTTRWNDGRGTLESSKLGVDDVRFIKAMIEEIARQAPLDRSRIYVTGPSNGGIMTYRLGCELPGTIAAIAPVIANIPVPLKSSCSPEYGLSILTINGAADPIIPLSGGTICKDVSKRMCEGGQSISRSESVGKFASANGCNSVPRSGKLPVRVSDGTWTEELIYTGCKSGAEVISYVVHGMGHRWPPMDQGLRKLGKSSKNLDATSVIVDFFLRHQRM